MYFGVFKTYFGGHINNIILTIGNVCIGGIFYVLAIIFLKVLSKEEFLLFPMGDKIYSLLTKFKIYKEQ